MDQVYMKLANDYIAGVRDAIRAEALKEYTESFDIDSPYMTSAEELAAATDNGTVPFKKFGDCPDPLYISPTSSITFSGHILIANNSCIGTGQYVMDKSYYDKWDVEMIKNQHKILKAKSEFWVDSNDYYDSVYKKNVYQFILYEKNMRRRLSKYCVHFLREQCPLRLSDGDMVNGKVVPSGSYAGHYCECRGNNIHSCRYGGAYSYQVDRVRFIIQFDFYLQEQLAFLNRATVEQRISALNQLMVEQRAEHYEASKKLDIREKKIAQAEAHAAQLIKQAEKIKADAATAAKDSEEQLELEIKILRNKLSEVVAKERRCNLAINLNEAKQTLVECCEEIVTMVNSTANVDTASAEMRNIKRRLLKLQLSLCDLTDLKESKTIAIALPITNKSKSMATVKSDEDGDEDIVYANDPDE